MDRPRTLADALTSRRKFVKVVRSNSNLSQMSDRSQASSTQMVRAVETEKKQNQVLKANLRVQEEKYKILQEKYNLLNRDYNDLRTNYSTLMSCYNKRDGALNYRAGRLLVKLLNRPTKDDLKKKNIYKNEEVFNTELLVVEKHESYSNIPKIVVECIELIDKSPAFMTTVGLYRASGNYSTIQNLRFDINSNNYKSLRGQKDPHTIIGVLKLFLREMASPLVTLKHLHEHIPNGQVFGDEEPEQKIRILRTLVYTLPPCNRDTLNYLIKHLVKVAAIIQNEMNAQSLSIVICKSVFFEADTDAITLENVQEVIASSVLPAMCIQEMIQNYYKVFDTLEMVDAFDHYTDESDLS